MFIKEFWAPSLMADSNHGDDAIGIAGSDQQKYYDYRSDELSSQHKPDRHAART
jgi:hypothetical protein